MPSIINALTASGGGVAITGDATGNLALQTAGNTAVTITTAQNVGIGTTNPTSALVVSGGVVSPPTVDGVHIGTQVGYATIEMCGTSGTGSFIDFTQSGTDSKGRILYSNASDFMSFSTNNIERMRIDSSGRVTTPYQPAFMAYLNNSFTNASPQTIVFDITQFNTGSNYSTSTGRFTAPVTGLYQFNIVVLVQGSSATMHDFSLQVNGSNYKNGRINAPDSTVNYSCAIRLNANDYVSVYVSSTGRPIYGASDWTYFSGFLVG